MRTARLIVCLLAAAVAVAVTGCGNAQPTEGLLSNIDKARNARSLVSLQTGLVTLGLVQSETPGGSAQDVAAALQAKDPTNRYTTAAPTDAGIVQVLGPGGGPVMLVAINSGPAPGRAPYYLAVWQGGGTTMYYAGLQPPAYSPQAPSGAGWSTTPPQ